jgi:membrane-bound serine protease (ClpP class)
MAVIAVAAAEAAPVTRTGHLNVVTIDGSINPASSDYLQKAIAESEADGAAALLLELDTPGGLVASTKDIIQAMLNARVPIIVYVAPQGAWAGSAGTFITIAGNVAAMAPGSSIGAAHPVGIGGGAPPEDEKGESSDPGARKAENLLAAFIESIAEQRKRNVEWAAKAVRESVAVTADKALELGVIDIVAATRSDLLTQLLEHPFPFEGETVVLDVATSRQRLIEMDALTRVLNVIVDPNVAVLLLMAGLLGLYIEFNQPGTLVPGVVGAACLLLALIAMQILPFSWIGLLLIAAGIALLVAEIFVTSYGVLFAAGVICFLIGGSMVFDRPDLSDLNVSFWPVLVPTVAGMALFGGLVVYAVGRTLGRRQESGVSELIGMTGVAATGLDPTGTVFIRGEYWNARADEPIEAEERVEATAVRGLELMVRRARPLA